MCADSGHSSDTLVIQSHRSPLPSGWLEKCLESARAWADIHNFDYRFIGDELFADVSEPLMEKTCTQRVVATDLARLLVLRSFLEQGYQRVVWCDADLLIFQPESLTLPAADFAVGREVWIQSDDTNGEPKAYIKVHNAFMLYSAGNAFLDFYIDSATRMLSLHEGRFVPQFIGPKLLTALHNIVHFPVIENAGMLSPSVVQDIVAGGGPSLDLFLTRSTEPLAAVNLCSSLALKGTVLEVQIEGAINLLLSNPALLGKSDSV